MRTRPPLNILNLLAKLIASTSNTGILRFKQKVKIDHNLLCIAQYRVQ